MFPPIHQCQNGHTLCSICRLRVNNRCPTCREELGDIRCLALEKVAESLELPCKNSSLGCMEIFPYYSKLKHEAQCNCRPYNCPYPGSECSVVGNIPFLDHHLQEDHKVDMHTGCTFNHLYVKSNPLEFKNATRIIMIYDQFGSFLYHNWNVYNSPTFHFYQNGRKVDEILIFGDDSDGGLEDTFAKLYKYAMPIETTQLRSSSGMGERKPQQLVKQAKIDESSKGVVGGRKVGGAGKSSQQSGRLVEAVKSTSAAPSRTFS